MNPEEGKLLCKMYLDTIQQEAETTKKVIRAIPDDQMSYKPDPKSKNAHELAWHIASSEVWFLDSIIAGSFSMGEPPAPPPPRAETHNTDTKRPKKPPQQRRIIQRTVLRGSTRRIVSTLNKFYEFC